MVVTQVNQIGYHRHLERKSRISLEEYGMTQSEMELCSGIRSSL